MAAYTSVTTKHATLTTTTVDTLTFTVGKREITIVNRVGAGNLAVTLGFKGAAAATPVQLADGTFVVLPTSTKTLELGTAVTSIKVLGNSNEYSVETV